MREGLHPNILALVRRRTGVVARRCGLPLDDVGWLMPPDDPALAALQAERRDDADAGVVRQAADLDRDIARLRAGWRPDAADLSQAPTILGRGLHFRMSVGPDDHSLSVQIRGEAFEAFGRQISRDRMTSAVVAVDVAEGRWARTLNRFYRLAHMPPEPHTEGERP